MLPNVIFQIVPLVQRKNTAPAMSFIYSILLNVGYGLFIGYAFNKSLLIPAIVFVAVTWAMIIIPCSYCCCPTNFQGNNFIVREIFSEQLQGIEFTDKLARNRAYPPTITVSATAYHYETRIEHYTTRDSNGRVSHHTRTRRERVTTWHGSGTLKYSSWEEDGNSIRIGTHNVLHAVAIATYKLDKSAKKGVESLRGHMRAQALAHDRYATVSNSFIVNGLIDSVCGTTEKEIPDIMRFYQSCIGRFLWVFFLVIGYQSAYESFWCASGERVVLKLKKKISMKEGKYRCKFNHEDGEAIETTFKMEDGSKFITEMPLVQGNFDYYFSQYPSVNAIDVSQINQPMMPQQMAAQPQITVQPRYPPNIQQPGYPPMQPQPGYPPMQPGMPQYGYQPGMVYPTPDPQMPVQTNGVPQMSNPYIQNEVVDNMNG